MGAKPNRSSASTSEQGVLDEFYSVTLASSKIDSRYWNRNVIKWALYSKQVQQPKQIVLYFSSSEKGKSMEGEKKGGEERKNNTTLDSQIPPEQVSNVKIKLKKKPLAGF